MHSPGTRFENIRQYSSLLDQATQAFDAPVMNGLPLLDEVKRRITENTICYQRNGDGLLVLCRHSCFYKLYYIVRRGAVLSLPRTDLPVIAEEVRLEGRPYPDHDALMEQSGFRLRRVNISLEVDLLHTAVADSFVSFSEIEPAAQEDLDAVDALMRASFDPVLDDIPTREELPAYMRSNAMYVLRAGGKIVAVCLFVTKGKTIMVRWTAIDKAFRNLGLGYVMSLYAEEQGRKRGLTYSTSWINVELDSWIKGFEHYGHRRGHRRLYLFQKDGAANPAL